MTLRLIDPLADISDFGLVSMDEMCRDFDDRYGQVDRCIGPGVNFQVKPSPAWNLLAAEQDSGVRETDT